MTIGDSTVIKGGSLPKAVRFGLEESDLQGVVRTAWNAVLRRSFKKKPNSSPRSSVRPLAVRLGVHCRVHRQRAVDACSTTWYLTRWPGIGMLGRVRVMCLPHPSPSGFLLNCFFTRAQIGNE